MKLSINSNSFVMKKKKSVGLSLNKKKISELSSSVQEQLNGGGYVSQVVRCPTGTTCNCGTLCVYSCSC